MELGLMRRKRGLFIESSGSVHVEDRQFVAYVRYTPWVLGVGIDLELDLPLIEIQLPFLQVRLGLEGRYVAENWSEVNY